MQADDIKPDDIKPDDIKPDDIDPEVTNSDPEDYEDVTVELPYGVASSLFRLADAHIVDKHINNSLGDFTLPLKSIPESDLRDEVDENVKNAESEFELQLHKWVEDKLESGFRYTQPWKDKTQKDTDNDDK